MIMHSLQSKRNSHVELFYKIVVLENLAKFTGKQPFWGLFFLIKLEASGLQLYWKRGSDTGVFL